MIRFGNLISLDEMTIYHNTELFLEENICQEKINVLNLINYTGYSVLDEYRQNIGYVKGVFEIPKNPLLLIEMENEEVMVPLVDEYIIIFDNENQNIVVKNIDKLIGL